MSEERIQKPGATYIKCPKNCCLLETTAQQDVYCKTTGEVFEPPEYRGAYSLSAEQLYTYYNLNVSGLPDKDFVDSLFPLHPDHTVVTNRNAGCLPAGRQVV
ncbi:MAG: hypothetical protein WAV41_03420 [Microgenomates group bacterium]